MEEELGHSANRYRALIEASSQALFRMSPDFSILIEVKGGSFVASTDTPNPNWLQDYHLPEDQALWLDHIKKSVETGTVLELEYRVKRIDGTQGWAFSRAVPVRDAAGRIVEWFGAASDVTDRKLAEEALRENEERYRKIFNNAIAGIAQTTLDGRCKAANPAFARMLGYDSPEELLNAVTNLGEQVYVDPKDRERLISMLNTPEGAVSDFEVNGKRKDGSVFWVSCSAVINRQDKKGGPFIDVIFIDITYRKLAETAMKESEQKARELAMSMQAILDAAPALIWIAHDRECRSISANRAAVRFCRLPEAANFAKIDVIAKLLAHCRIFHEGKELAAEKLPIYKVAATGNPVNDYSLEFVFDDGSRHFLILNYVPLISVEGQIEGIVVAGLDLTELKLAEMKLREVSQQLNYHVGNSPLAVMEWGEDRRIVRWSGGAERIFGWRSEEVVGKRLGELNLFFEQDMPLVTRVSTDMRNGNRLQSAVSIRNHRKDGSLIYCEWYSSMLKDDANRPCSMLSLVLDVTEKKQMEEELRKSRDELELRVGERTAELERANIELRSIPSRLICAQEEERKRLASELHDSIGQTLAALKFNVEFVLSARKRGDDVSNLLEQFVPTLQQSIDETRSIYLGLRPRMIEERGIVETLYWFRRDFMRLYPHHHVELEIAVDEKEIPEELKLAIFRITQEALNNISKYSRAEWVDLCLRKVGRGIELTIADDGMGMDIADIRSNSATGRSLGLTSMRERAEFTAGRFSITSTPGEGTTVRVLWPKSPGHR
ncbi:MAG: PAS domain S-box protein [Syntrophobacteraceae bacterium]